MEKVEKEKGGRKGEAINEPVDAGVKSSKKTKGDPKKAKLVENGNGPAAKEKATTSESADAGGKSSKKTKGDSQKAKLVENGDGPKTSGKIAKETKKATTKGGGGKKKDLKVDENPESMEEGLEAVVEEVTAKATKSTKTAKSAKPVETEESTEESAAKVGSKRSKVKVPSKNEPSAPKRILRSTAKATGSSKN